MATRVAAASLLIVSAIVAWLTVSVPLAARALQVGIVASMIYVAWLAWHGSRVMRGALAEARTAPTGGRPFVSLILPARDEATVIGSTVRALASLDYPGADGAPAYEVIVIDDGSTDATAERAAAGAAWSARVSIVRRDASGGPRTKGAVLAFAMPHVRGDVIGVIDADTHVEPAFLERVLHAWQRDPEAAALQVARRERNASVSWLTQAQADEQLMDMTSQCGRWATDGSAELRGNGMFVRRAALEAVGGWGERALTEDLDLSTRLAANGERVTLAPEAAVNEEAVESLAALWRQRKRWAEGSLRRLLDHGPGLLLGSQPLTRKADFLAFATEFLVPPLFAATVVASLLTAILPRPAEWTVPVSLFIGYGLGVFALALGGLLATGERGVPLLGRAVRGALFLSHWLLVVPFVLIRIAFGPEQGRFVQTPRFMTDDDR